MKKISLYFCAVLFLLSVGCASGKIHERSYLRAISVSREAGSNLVLSFFEEEDTIAASGEDIDLAKQNAELKNGKPVFTGYTELLILDGRDSLSCIEHMLNVWKVSPSCMVAYSTCGEELIGSIDSERLIGIAGQAVEQGIAPECDVITVLAKLYRGEQAEVAELYPDGTAGSYELMP